MTFREKLILAVVIVSTVCVVFFLLALLILKIICAEEKKLYTVEQFHTPKETHALETSLSCDVKSMFTKNAQITVQLNDWVTHGRSSSGDIVPVMPDIKITVDFTGEWDSKEKMDFDMAECISKLNETYRLYISGGLLSSGND